MKKNSLNNKGFSLVELIVAVLIMAIISGAAIATFGFSNGMKAKAAAKAIMDVMKQTRAEALGRENKPADDKTNVYAKFYTDDGAIFVDVCTNISGSESVLFHESICSDLFRVHFYDDSSNLIADVGDDTVYVYFLKSTGGVASVQNGTDLPVTNVQMIKVVDSSGSNDYQDMILVSLTGRCYLDE